MPLISQDKKHAQYFEYRAILFDTCGLSWFAKQPLGHQNLVTISKKYLLLIPTVTLYEFGFGLPEQLSSAEIAIRNNFMKSDACIEMREYDSAQMLKKLPESGFFVINPGFREWWTARDRQLKHAKNTKAKIRNVKQKLSFDALIHAIARNCFAPICTENIDDFCLLNQIGASNVFDGTVPIFKPSQILNSLTSDELCVV